MQTNSKQKTAAITGGTGFIGHHMARRLKSEGYWVRVIDIKDYEYGAIDFADEFVKVDLRTPIQVRAALRLDKGKVYSFYPPPFEEIIQFDEVYDFACVMGGAGFIFTGDNDADIMRDSAIININTLEVLRQQKFKGKLFYSSSACVYPEFLQKEYHNKGLSESDAIPASPDSCYGWEKLFSEQMYMAHARNYSLDVRIARFHNIYGPEGTYKGGREKAPAAMCRKVAEIGPRDFSAFEEPYIEVWGTGHQTRSFLYIDDCIDAVRLLMQSDFKEPLNIGSEEMVTINQLAQMAIDISGKDIKIKNVDGPQGVMGRNSNNELIEKVLGWKPKYNLKQGMQKTFNWINERIKLA